jgi:hypothetical protein
VVKPNSAVASSKPATAESLNDWSPRPPTSKTRPTLRFSAGVPVPPVSAVVSPVVSPVVSAVLVSVEPADVSVVAPVSVAASSSSSSSSPQAAATSAIITSSAANSRQLRNFTFPPLDGPPPARPSSGSAEHTGR